MREIVMKIAKVPNLLGLLLFCFALLCSAFLALLRFALLSGCITNDQNFRHAGWYRIETAFLRQSEGLTRGKCSGSRRYLSSTPGNVSPGPLPPVSAKRMSFDHEACGAG